MTHRISKFFIFSLILVFIIEAKAQCPDCASGNISCCSETECNSQGCEYYTDESGVPTGPCICNETQCNANRSFPLTCHWDGSSCKCQDCGSEVQSACNQAECDMDARCAFIDQLCLCNQEQCAETSIPQSTCAWIPVTKTCDCEDCEAGEVSICGRRKCQLNDGCIYDEEEEVCICTSQQCTAMESGRGIECTWGTTGTPSCDCVCVDCTEDMSSCCDQVDCEGMGSTDGCQWNLPSGACICDDIQCQAIAEVNEACWFVNNECNCASCDSCITGGISCCNEILCTEDTRCGWDTASGRCICNEEQCDELANHPGDTCAFDSVAGSCTCDCEDCTAGESSCCDNNENECLKFPDDCFYEGITCLCSDKHCETADGASDISCFIDVVREVCGCQTCADCLDDDISCCNEHRCLDEGCVWDEEKSQCYCNVVQCEEDKHPGEACIFDDVDGCTCLCLICSEGTESCCGNWQCIDDGCQWDEVSGSCQCSDEQCDEWNSDTSQSCKFTDGDCICVDCSNCSGRLESCCNEPTCDNQTGTCYWEEEGRMCICNNEQCEAFNDPAPGFECVMVQSNSDCECTCTNCDQGEESCCDSSLCGAAGGNCFWDISEARCFCNDDQCHAHLGTPSTSCYQDGMACECLSCGNCGEDEVSCCHQPKCKNAGEIGPCFFDEPLDSCFCTSEQCEAVHKTHEGESCEIVDDGLGNRSCNCDCSTCNLGDESCCEMQQCNAEFCEWNTQGQVCACNDHQCQVRDGYGNEQICTWNGTLNRCVCVACSCDDGVQSCCDETLCGETTATTCYYDSVFETCICNDLQCEVLHDDSTHDGVTCDFDHTIEQCDCVCEDCKADTSSCCDTTLCAASVVDGCFWDDKHDVCICTDSQCQTHWGDSNNSCSIGLGECVCDWCPDCTAGTESCCSSGSCPSPGECQWTTDDVCICTKDQCTHYESPNIGPGSECDMIEVQLGVFECQCECISCEAGESSCCDAMECVAEGCQWDTGCFCTDLQCDEANGTDNNICSIGESGCDCVGCLDCSSNPVSCCNERRCGDNNADADCFWDDDSALCICTQLQCEELFPDALEGEDCDIVEGSCECVCASCDIGDVSCCDDTQCQTEGSNYDSDCHWTTGGATGTFGCFCTTAQCQDGFADVDESCIMEDGQCQCSECSDCLEGLTSCCNEPTCEGHGDPCYFDQGLGLCLCSLEQCQDAHGGDQLAGVQCEHDPTAGICECSCNCFVSEISCCSEQECNCGGGTPCACHWNDELGKCYCTVEQCEADAEPGQDCELDAVEGCQCEHVEMVQPQDNFGEDYDGRMVFMDLFITEILSPAAFSDEFVSVAARSTGAGEHQFVIHGLYSLGESESNTRPSARMLRGRATLMSERDGVINSDSAAEVFRVVDDEQKGVSAHRVMVSLETQLEDPHSVFYREFIVPQGASGATFEYEPTVEDNMWMIIAIVFIVLCCVLVLIMVGCGCYFNNKKKKEQKRKEEEEAAAKAAAAEKAKAAERRPEAHFEEGFEKGGAAAAAKRETEKRERAGVARHSLVPVPQVLVTENST